MKRSGLLLLLCFLFIISCTTTIGTAGDRPQVPTSYEYLLEATSVKDQSNTGTCWAYNTISFLESECIRKGIANTSIDLSEMYIVYYAYIEKARLYLTKMGDNPFTEGGEDYDTLMVIDKYGIVRESDYKAKNKTYHADIVDKMLKVLDETITKYKEKGKIPNEVIENAISKIRTILDEGFNSVPVYVLLDDIKTEPVEYAKDVLRINVNDYVNITSFTHLPKYEYVELELPDNWQHYDKYINVSLDEMFEIAKNSIRMGYSVSYGSDITEPLVDWKKGVFLVRSSERKDNIEEMAELRQMMFENGATTDDHGMHIIGLSENEKTGFSWFYLKNSWGRNVGDNGFMNMSEYYFKLKTISIMVNKEILTDFEYILPQSAFYVE